MAQEKFNLQWNDFSAHITSSFQEMIEDKDFNDVTLVSEDEQYVSAHRVLIAASSSVFKSMMVKMKGKHPMLFLKGVKGVDLSSMLEFIYKGQANVLQENLASFMEIAELFKLKGLSSENRSTPENEITSDIKYPNQNELLV